MDESQYLTVTALNRYIAYKIDADASLKTVYIKGEVSDTRYAKGHLFFVLKDENASIGAIIFSNTLRNSLYLPKDGDKVMITGGVTVYPKKGSYNLLVSKISEAGAGQIYREFLELKEKLEKEGLFSPDRKKPIPMINDKIAVITARTADALQDILFTINGRWPLAKVRVYNALVQGNDAPGSLIKALRKAETERFGDVVIIARGGGSIEDLNCFNNEELARTISRLSLPVVSGIGHENDYTICDFVADLRAPTPTGAAVAVTPDKNAVLRNLAYGEEKMKASLHRLLTDCENKYRHPADNYYLRSFDHVIADKVRDLDYKTLKLQSLSPLSAHIRCENTLRSLRDRLQNACKGVVTSLSDLLDRKTERLGLINPLHIMEKGYSLVYRDDELIVSAASLATDDRIKIIFRNGEVNAVVGNKGVKNG